MSISLKSPRRCLGELVWVLITEANGILDLFFFSFFLNQLNSVMVAGDFFFFKLQCRHELKLNPVSELCDMCSERWRLSAFHANPQFVLRARRLARVTELYSVREHVCRSEAYSLRNV